MDTRDLALRYFSSSVRICAVEMHYTSKERFMNMALVRMHLKGIADGNTSQFDTSKQNEAIKFLDDRVYLVRPDKGSAERQYQPKIEQAAKALRLASGLASG